MVIRMVGALMLVLGLGAVLAAPEQIVSAETSPAPETTPAPEKHQAGVPLSTHTSPPATLSPDLFSGAVREGYVIAQTIPDVLAELHCYCGCDRSMGHGNLLDCFVDDHAAG